MSRMLCKFAGGVFRAFAGTVSRAARSSGIGCSGWDSVSEARILRIWICREA